MKQRGIMTDSIITVADERRNLMFMRSMTEVSPRMRTGLIESARQHYELAKERAFRRIPLPDSRVIRQANADAARAIDLFRMVGLA